MFRPSPPLVGKQHLCFLSQRRAAALHVLGSSGVMLKLTLSVLDAELAALRMGRKPTQGASPGRCRGRTHGVESAHDIHLQALQIRHKIVEQVMERLRR